MRSGKDIYEEGGVFLPNTPYNIELKISTCDKLNHKGAAWDVELYYAPCCTGQPCCPSGSGFNQNGPWPYAFGICASGVGTNKALALGHMTNVRFNNTNLGCGWYNKQKVCLDINCAAYDTVELALLQCKGASAYGAPGTGYFLMGSFNGSSIGSGYADAGSVCKDIKFTLGGAGPSQWRITQLGETCAPSFVPATGSGAIPDFCTYGAFSSPGTQSSTLYANLKNVKNCECLDSKTITMNRIVYNDVFAQFSGDTIACNGNKYTTIFGTTCLKSFLIESYIELVSGVPHTRYKFVNPGTSCSGDDKYERIDGLDFYVTTPDGQTTSVEIGGGSVYVEDLGTASPFGAPSPCSGTPVFSIFENIRPSYLFKVAVANPHYPHDVSLNGDIWTVPLQRTYQGELQLSGVYDNFKFKLEISEDNGASWADGFAIDPVNQEAKSTIGPIDSEIKDKIVRYSLLSWEDMTTLRVTTLELDSGKAQLTAELSQAGGTKGACSNNTCCSDPTSLPTNAINFVETPFTKGYKFGKGQCRDIIDITVTE